MKMYKSALVVGLVSVAFMVNSEVASAKGDVEMSDSEFCESDARQAGMENEADIREYVAQCLEELRLQNNGDSELDMGSDPEEDNSSNM